MVNARSIYSKKHSRNGIIQEGEKMSTILEVKNFWEAYAKNDPLWAILTSPSKKYNNWNLKDFFETGKNEIQTLINHLNIFHIKYDLEEALDFGCGVGRLTQPLSNHFKHVVGVDISPEMISKANAFNTQPNISYIQNDAENLQIFKNETFTFIYTNIVLQHLEPPFILKYLLEFERILKHDGVMVFQLPSHLTNISKKGINLEMEKFSSPDAIQNKSETYVDLPSIPMYGISIDKMIPFLLTQNLIIECIERDHWCGEEWYGYKYYVKKP